MTQGHQGTGRRVRRPTAPRSSTSARRRERVGRRRGGGRRAVRANDASSPGADLRRLVPTTQPVPIPAAASGAPRSVTVRLPGDGSLGGVGFALARHLVADTRPTSSWWQTRPVPPQGIEHSGRSPVTATTIRPEPPHPSLRELRVLRDQGHGRRCGLADPSVRPKPASTRPSGQVGSFDGVIHAAGELHDRPIALSLTRSRGRGRAPRREAAHAAFELFAERGWSAPRARLVDLDLAVADGRPPTWPRDSVLDVLAGHQGSSTSSRSTTGCGASWGRRLHGPSHAVGNDRVAVDTPCSPAVVDRDGAVQPDRIARGRPPLGRRWPATGTGSPCCRGRVTSSSCSRRSIWLGLAGRSASGRRHTPRAARRPRG